MTDIWTSDQPWLGTSDKTYVLGLDYQVKDDIHWTDAVTNILHGKQTLFMGHPTKRVRSTAGAVNLPMPLIVRNNKWVDLPYVAQGQPNERATRSQILLRDQHICGYCGNYGNTVDHIKPLSRCKRDGDPHNGWTWGNLVTACKRCNFRKANRTPEEAGMPQPVKGSTYKYTLVQSIVQHVLETGEGYCLEAPLAEGILV